MKTRNAELTDGIRVVLATETPVRLANGEYEKLIVNNESISLRSPEIPIFVQHNTQKLNIGIVKNIKVEGRELVGEMVFSEREEAKEIEKDVVDGILQNVSIGFEILSQRNENDLNIVDKAEIHELSIVGLPADKNARIKRERNIMFESDDTQSKEFNKTRAEFDLTKVIRSFAEKKAVDGLEKEVSEELKLRSGIRHGGLMVPDSALFSERAQILTTDTNLVSTDHRSDLFIEYLRNESRFINRGVRILDGLVGNVSIPRQSAVTAAGWMKGDGTGALQATKLEADNISLTPKFAGAIAEFSYQAAIQSSPAVQDLIRRDLLAAYVECIDKAIAYGDTTTNADEPNGIALLAGTNKETVATASIDLAKLREIELALKNAKANNLSFIAANDVDDHIYYELAYAAATGNSKTLAEAWRIKGESCNGLASGDMFVGDFNNVVLGRWGGMLLESTNSHGDNFSSGVTAIRVLGAVDIGVRYDDHFTYLKKS